MEVKTCTFSAPCPVFDVEAMQTWLEDLSMEGYLLKGIRSQVWQTYEFYEIEPLATRYRLTPVSNKMDEWNLRPGEEYVSITEAFGWEHVCSNLRFHIFRAYDEDAREIHTEPAIQAQAVRQLGWRIAKTAMVWLSLPLFYMMIMFALGGKNNFWQNLILERKGIQITIAYFVMFAAVKAMVDLVRLFKFYRKLKQGYTPVNRKDWRKHAARYRARYLVYRGMLAVCALLLILGRMAYRDHAAYQDLAPVGAELPFLSVADMAGESDVQSAQRLEDVNYMRSWSHALSPVNYDWAEIVDVVDRDGTEGRVSIQVYYHEVKYGWLAESLAEEYLAKAKLAGPEMTEYPETHADLAYFFYNEYGKPSAVLRYGNVVVDVNFPRTDMDDPHLQFAYWIEALDASLTG